MMSEAQTDLWTTSHEPNEVARFVRALTILLRSTSDGGITRPQLEWAMDKLVQLMEAANDAVPKIS